MFWGNAPRIGQLTRPRRAPSLKSRCAVARSRILIQSHFDLSGRGWTGGVRPKSPGLSLCSVFPVYRTWLASVTSCSGLLPRATLLLASAARHRSKGVPAESARSELQVPKCSPSRAPHLNVTRRTSPMHSRCGCSSLQVSTRIPLDENACLRTDGGWGRTADWAGLTAHPYWYSRNAPVPIAASRTSMPT